MNIEMIWIRIWGCLNPAQLLYFCFNRTPYQIHLWICINIAKWWFWHKTKSFHLIHHQNQFRTINSNDFLRLVFEKNRKNYNNSGLCNFQTYSKSPKAIKQPWNIFKSAETGLYMFFWKKKRFEKISFFRQILGLYWIRLI